MPKGKKGRAVIGFPMLEGNQLFEAYCRYRVEKFAVKGNEESAGVVLTGYKRLSTGEEVQLVSPKIKWEGNYQFINELRSAIDKCIDEVEQYHNGKKAPDVQGDLFTEGQEELNDEYLR